MPVGRKKSTSEYTYRNKVCLVKGGHEYFNSLEAMINAAKKSVHLQTYIYENDETGRQISEALKKAAQRGVKVFLLVDGYASKNLGRAFENEMADAGVHFRYFEPLLKSRYFYFGRRLHHKIAVADAFTSLVAGVNISDRYNDLPGHPAWLDWALHVEGEASSELFKVCTELWFKSATRAMHEWKEQKLPAIPEEWDCAVKVRRNDWVHRHNQITRSYIEMLQRAEKHIIIMSSYFLPGRLIRRHIRRAAERGVKVSVMLAGESDILLAKNAERYIYRWLFKHGINVYEYPTKVLHGKLSTYDDKWVTLGSYNVNNISAYASVELNLDIDNEEFATSVRSRLERIIHQECILVTEETYAPQNNFLHRTIQIISYEIVRLMIYVFTFYFKQR